MSYSEHTSTCPYCNKEITLPVDRWETKEKCPECGKEVLIDYDFIIMDDEDEWDIYEFKKVTEVID
jgi:rRNA maturation endonuclease Nob1